MTPTRTEIGRSAPQKSPSQIVSIESPIKSFFWYEVRPTYCCLYSISMKQRIRQSSCSSRNVACYKFMFCNLVCVNVSIFRLMNISHSFSVWMGSDFAAHLHATEYSTPESVWTDASHAIKRALHSHFFVGKLRITIAIKKMVFCRFIWQWVRPYGSRRRGYSRLVATGGCAPSNGMTIDNTIRFSHTDVNVSLWDLLSPSQTSTSSIILKMFLICILSKHTLV